VIEQIVRASIHRAWLVMLAVTALAALGVYNFQRLPIDAVPDITNVQVQINTEAPGYSPLEAEQRITFPIETTLAGLPRLSYTRSLSRYGLSQVTVVFRTEPTSTSRASSSTSACSRPAAKSRRVWSPRWARSPPALARSSCTPSSQKALSGDRMANNGLRPI
jgi:hypothetical protein